MTVRTLLADLLEVDFEVLAWPVRIEGTLTPVEHLKLDLGTREVLLVLGPPPKGA